MILQLRHRIKSLIAIFWDCDAYDCDAYDCDANELNGIEKT